jgi:hypothetical protein
LASQHHRNHDRLQRRHDGQHYDRRWP